ncbi:MAG: M4 family metallopeptidase [Anaerolineales bacterium]|nr:M4 family metallopeptidase [Anaerolineales bacterium]
MGAYAPASIYKSLTLQGGWDSTFTSQTGYSIVQGSATADGITTSGTYVSISRFVVQNSKFGIYHNGGTLSFEQGGLINNKNGIYNSSGDTSFTNTTISGNQGGSYVGSAISNVHGIVHIQYTTITSNAGSYAIHNINSDSYIEIGNSILAGNGPGDCDVESTHMTSTGHNIFGNSPVCSDPSSFIPDSTDQVGVDPELLPLFALGYHPIASTSPAVDHADPASCPATDQRGTTRPQGAACDIGAFEYMAPGSAAFLGIVSGSDQHSGPSLPFQFPLVVYVTDNTGSPVSGVTVIFTAPTSGPGGTFEDTQNSITVATTNDNGIATSSMFTANSQIGSYNVVATSPGLSGSVSFALANVAWFVAPTGNDSNSCSVPAAPCLTINKAVTKAADGDTIRIAVGTYAPASIYKILTLQGGWDSTFTSQNGYSIVQGSATADGITTSGANVSISKFIVQNSKYGVYNSAVTLRFEQGALLNNKVGFYNYATGNALLINTTISGNQSSGIPGSAISNRSGIVRIQYSTLANNGGSYAVYGDNSSTVSIEIGNSILAGNSVGDCYVENSKMISMGHNIFGRYPACVSVSSFAPDPSDLVDVDPGLSPLLSFGYHVLASTSLAVNRADPATCPATDQRGVTRPTGAACDIGAVEYTAPGPAISLGVLSGSNQHTAPSLPFRQPFTVFLVDAGGNPVPGAAVTFTAPASGPSGTFADTQNNTTIVTTNENGIATSSPFTANSQMGSYNVTVSVSSVAGAVNFSLTNVAWFVASTGNDTNSCSLPTAPCLTLESAMAKAGTGDPILIAAEMYPPTVISKSLTLLGGWDSTFSAQTGYSTIQGNPTSNGLSVSGADVYISRFIIQKSKFGIYHENSGTLHFDQGASINNNNGIYNYSGTSIISNTTISGNHAGDTDGYVYSGSAISLIEGTVRIQYSTITNNGGTEAISIANPYKGNLEIGNSILAGNPRGDCNGEKRTMSSLGHNLFGSVPVCRDSSYPFIPAGTDRVGVDPQLLPLFTSGFHPLLNSSPAIDAGDSFQCPPVDQRGGIRPAGEGCDIGAIEYSATGTTPQYIIAYEGSPQLLVTNGAALSRLIVLVLDEDGNSIQGEPVTFTAPYQGASAIFTDTGTNISTAVTDVNGFATSAAFSANSIGGRYSIVATVNGVSMPASFILGNSTLAIDTKIQTYTANNYISLPGTFLCNQSKPGCTNGFDGHADAAHEFATGTYSLYAIEHSRNSINNAGMTIISSVHYSDAYANAAWNGSQMVYGDTYDFPLADDVVAHELTHGVTQYESDLFYYYQSGAINESFSDLWGEYYDQTNGKGNDTSAVKWLIGEDVLDLGALRNMSDPTVYGDPDQMTSSNYYIDTSDNGGVHSNSGINNKAVFLMVEGGSFNGKTVAAIGWDKTIAIYYEVNTHLLSSGSDYSDLYYAIQQACSDLIGQKGITTADCSEVKNAIDAVEMNGQPIANFNADVPYCDQGGVRVNVFSDDLESGRGNWTFDNGAYPRWQLDSPYGRYAHSGNHFLFADDYPGDVTDASAILVAVTIPNDVYLHFAHAYDFEAYEASGYYDDGGVLEYSVDGGATWHDAESLIDFNGYKGTIRTSPAGNPLQGRSAFVGSSHGYISTRLNLASLAGQTVTFRWRMGLDALGYAWGWWVDDVIIYQCMPEDTVPPNISSIRRIGAEYTSFTDVDFTVIFSEAVTGVDTTDFTLTTTGVTGASITGVSGSGNTYIVTVNTGSGNGTIRLDMVDDDSIKDAANNPLGGVGTGNGNFTGGETYTITKSANVGVTIGSNPPKNYTVAPSGRITNRYGINGGPVRVRSTNGMAMFTSQRAIYGSSFNSIVGFPADQLTTEYWFTSLDDAGMITYLVIGNPSETETAEVDVYIGGVKKNTTPYSIPPGQRVYPRYGINGGPVRVVSTNGVSVFTSERTKYGNSFNEVMGFPSTQLDTEFWFTSYDDAGMITYLVIGNPSETETALVDVYIGGVKKNTTPYSILPGQRVFPRYGINGGPVRVVSTNGVKVFTSERTKYGNSFNEVLGYPIAQTSTELWFTSLDDASMITYLVIGNPSETETAEVDVYIGGVKKNTTPYSILPGQRVFPRYGINGGPVRVVSTNGVKVFTSERTKYLSSFNEILGIPTEGLTTDYWYTSLDDVGMTTELVIAAP